MKIMNKIIIGIVIVGFGFLILGFALGGRSQIRTMYDNRELHFGWTNRRNIEYHDVNEEFTDIDNLYFDIQALNVVIEEYSGNTIKVEGTFSSNIDIKKNGNTMEVLENKSRFTQKFSFGLDFWYDDRLTIYIPEGLIFNKVNMNVDAGSVTSKGTLNTKEIRIDVGMGQVYATSIICEEAVFDAALGNISISLLDSQNSDFNVGVGKINAKLVGGEDEYSYDVICNVGEVNIGSYQSKGISSRDVGGRGLRLIHAQCDVGSINIKMKEG